MKRIGKSLAAVLVYLLMLCIILKAKAVLLFSPRHIGMFFLGCLILCLPYLEKKSSFSDWKEIFRNNAMMAGGLEAFMLIFVGMSREGMMPEEAVTEIALGMRPLFYGFVCYVVLRGGKAQPQKDMPPMEEDMLPVGGNMPPAKEEVPKYDFSCLTRQERQVAALIEKGLTNREIGEELCISETTVKKHVSNIFEKLGISSRKDLQNRREKIENNINHR